MAMFHSTCLTVFARSSCSSPSTKELHGSLITFAQLPFTETFLDQNGLRQKKLVEALIVLTILIFSPLQKKKLKIFTKRYPIASDELCLRYPITQKMLGQNCNIVNEKTHQKGGRELRNIQSYFTMDHFGKTRQYCGFSPLLRQVVFQCAQ